MRAPQYLPGFSPAPLGLMALRVPISSTLGPGPLKLPKEWTDHPLCFFIERRRHKPRGNPEIQTAVYTFLLKPREAAKSTCPEFPSHESPTLWPRTAQTAPPPLRGSCPSLGQVVFEHHIASQHPGFGEPEDSQSN